MEMHPCEPSLEELKKIKSTLYGQKSTSENVKRIEALEKQIVRHEKFYSSEKSEEKSLK